MSPERFVKGESERTQSVGAFLWFALGPNFVPHCLQEWLNRRLIESQNCRLFCF